MGKTQEVTLFENTTPLAKALHRHLQKADGSRARIYSLVTKTSVDLGREVLLQTISKDVYLTLGLLEEEGRIALAGLIWVELNAQSGMLNIYMDIARESAYVAVLLVEEVRKLPIIHLTKAV